MSTAKNVEAVNALMSSLGVSLADLETYGFIESIADSDPGITVTVPEAFDRLVSREFNLGWETSHVSEHYYYTGRDSVQDALEKARILSDRDDDLDDECGAEGECYGGCRGD